ncbi:MAG: hypothetical protein PQJ60_06120, partial [Spirochaetales bacterium]|nr:hypothetical protein [Spirochaetales bacterium]
IFHSYFYFLPYYLMGIFYCQHQESIERRIYNLLSLILFSFLSVFSIVANVNYWNLHDQVNNVIFINDGFLTFVSKVSLIIVLLILTKWMTKKEHPLTDIIGSTSFTIYFLHAFFMQKLYKFITPYTGSLFLDIISMLLLTIDSIVLSVFAARFLKQLFDKKSRYLVGY